jgi:hypothetical protein
MGYGLVKQKNDFGLDIGVFTNIGNPLQLSFGDSIFDKVLFAGYRQEGNLCGVTVGESSLSAFRY